MTKQLSSLLMAICAFGWVMWLEVQPIEPGPQNPRPRWSFTDTFETKLACELEQGEKLSNSIVNMSERKKRFPKFDWFLADNMVVWLENEIPIFTSTFHCVPDHIDPRPIE